MTHLLASVGLFFVVAAASGANFTVTTTNDSGPGSLRDAIALANTTPGADTINFIVTGTIVLTSGPLQISDALTIDGPGAANLTIDGNGTNRVFAIIESTPPACPALSGPSDFQVTINGLTLQNGIRTQSNAGGAIFSAKSLTLQAVTIQNNAAHFGGGVYFAAQYPGQSLSIQDSQFLNNFAKQTTAVANNVGGGALNLQDYCIGSQASAMASAAINNTLFSGNHSQPTTLAGYAGAMAAYFFGNILITNSRFVDNHVDPPTPRVGTYSYAGGAMEIFAKSITIRNSEFSLNSADYGGGFEVTNFDPALQGAGSVVAFVLANSTVSGNVANLSGGGINIFSNVAAQIDNSTVNGNSAPATHTGGVRVSAGTGLTPPTLAIVSSILANSPAGTVDIGGLPSANIPSPYTVSATNSLVQTYCADCVIAGTGNLTGVDPMVGPLAFNGGPTQTQALMPGSTAINAGSNPLGLATDQRGGGYPRVVGGTADMGAYELNAFPCGSGSYPFPYIDVASVGAAFCPGIMEAYVTGVSRGTTPDTFNPNNTVSRVQMTTFLQRSLDQGLTRTSRRAVLNQLSTPQTTNAMQTIAAGSGPQFCAADGNAIWASAFGGNQVIQVQAGTGRVLGTWTGATEALGVMVAAGKVFVAGGVSPGKLYVIDPTQPPGAVATAASNLGNGPNAIAFDGTKLWTTQLFGASVSIITPQATTPYPVTTVTTGFTNPNGILYDGVHIWVTDNGVGKLLKLDASGNILQTVTVGAAPGFPAFDGTNIWVPNRTGNSITVVQASSGNVVATINADASNLLNGPTAASFDGERILVTNVSGGSVTVFKAADLSFIGNVVTGVSTQPYGACSDGVNFWVVLHGTGNLLRF